MHLILRLSVVAAVVLAGCASQTTTTASAGKHLVYRDTAGNATRQFDYPDDAFCRRVQALAGSAAHCQEAPAAGLQARATLRYTPPGVLVEGHYSDLARCRADTGAMSTGVQVINPCTTK